MSDEKKKKHWIKSAIGEHRGALTEKAHSAGKSPMAYSTEHEHDSGKTGKQARLALTLQHMNHKKMASGKTIRKSMYHGEE